MKAAVEQLPVMMERMPAELSLYSIGVDLGGTNLRIAAVGPQGEVREKIALETEVKEGRERVVEDMCAAITDLRLRMGGAPLAGIGIGVPGVINLASGMVFNSPNLPGWNDFPVRDEIERRLHTRVMLENDANAAALGEKCLGAGRDVSGLCILTLGTGIGGGLVLDGRVWHGQDGMGAELGHMTIDPNGALCACGNLGCIEAYASASAIVRMANAAIRVGRSAGLTAAAEEVGELTAEMVYVKARQGDRVACEIFEMVGRSLGVAISSLINIFNLPLYVVGGGVARGWDAFAPALLAEVEKRSVVYRASRTRVEPAALGADAGLLGAAWLPQLDRARLQAAR